MHISLVASLISMRTFMKKNIVWLASYPKSGNTWFRIFLTNLRSEKAVPVDINAIITDGIFSSKAIFEIATGVDASELKPDEADQLRADVFRYYSNRFDDFLFIKAHDAYTYLRDGKPIFPSDVSYGAIYFVRNPLDVAVSWAFHKGGNLEEADKNINTYTITAIGSTYKNQLPQKITTWKEHVISWQSNQDIPILILRFEDMKNKPLETFKKAIQFLNWEYSDQEIEAAIEKSKFKNLKNQEQKKDFIEKQKGQSSFFRKGIVGDWKNHLTGQQIENILSYNASMMEKLGYSIEKELGEEQL